MTGVIRQLILYRWPDPDPVANPDGNVLLGAVEGDVVFTSCDHFDIDYHTLGLYYWRPGIVPFVDPFDIPYTPPGPPGHAEYDRMPMP